MLSRGSALSRITLAPAPVPCPPDDVVCCSLALMSITLEGDTSLEQIANMHPNFGYLLFANDKNRSSPPETVSCSMRPAAPSEALIVGVP